MNSLVKSFELMRWLRQIGVRFDMNEDDIAVQSRRSVGQSERESINCSIGEVYPGKSITWDIVPRRPRPASKAMKAARLTAGVV